MAMKRLENIMIVENVELGWGDRKVDTYKMSRFRHFIPALSPNRFRTIMFEPHAFMGREGYRLLPEVDQV
jgi:hypothetical protein